jgi:hypothetical protein
MTPSASKIVAKEDEDLALDALLNNSVHELSATPLHHEIASCSISGGGSVASKSGGPKPILKTSLSYSLDESNTSSAQYLDYVSPPIRRLSLLGSSLKKSPSVASSTITGGEGGQQQQQNPQPHHIHIHAQDHDDKSTVSLSDSLSLSSKLIPPKRTNSNVSFKSVEIREYDRTLGDNPACTCGPPISLDWSYSSESQLAINDYEKVRDMRRRKKEPMFMTKEKREHILKNQLGYSNEEIKVVLDETRQVRRNRSVTKLISPLWKVEDAVKSAQRKIGRKLSGTGGWKSSSSLGSSIGSSKSSSRTRRSNGKEKRQGQSSVQQDLSISNRSNSSFIAEESLQF